MNKKFTPAKVLVVTTNAGDEHKAIFGPFAYRNNPYMKTSCALLVFPEKGHQQFHLVEQLSVMKNDPVYCKIEECPAQNKSTRANCGPAPEISDISNDDQAIRFLARRIWNLSSDNDAPDGIKGYTLEEIKGG